MEVLGVPAETKWEECNNLVHEYLTGDWMLNLMPQIADMLDNSGIEILVYSGDQDFSVNWKGGEAWTLATKWSKKEQFNNTDYSDWMVNGHAAGAMRQFENFHFLRFHDAGHMVPMDQPAYALAMLSAFIANDWNLASDETIVA